MKTIGKIVVFCLSCGIAFMLTSLVLFMVVSPSSSFVANLFGFDGSNDILFNSLVAFALYIASGVLAFFIALEVLKVAE